MTEGIRAPNLPLRTDLSEFLGIETNGTQKSLGRFSRASVIGNLEAAVNSFIAGGGAIFTTLLQAQANLNYAANQMAWVIQDATPANNGIYQKQGASGSGSWSRLGDLPYSFYRAVNEGAGTANAIKATNGYPMANKDALIVFNVTDTTTASPVTLSLNDGTPLTVKTASGNDIAPGGLVAGMMVAGYIDGDEFRLLSDQASAAIQAAAEAAQNAAEAARDIATGAMSTFLATVFDLKATALTYSPDAAPNYIRLEGHTIQGEGGALYKKVGSEPSHPGKFSITLSDGVTVTWYEISERLLTPLMFGGKRDATGFDCWQSFKDCLDTIAAQAVNDASRYGATLYLPAGQYETSKTITINTPGVRVKGEGSVTSVIKAQSGFVGSWVLVHTSPDLVATMVGSGVIGVGIDCDEIEVGGYLGEALHDNILYDDFRISKIHADVLGFVIQPKAGHWLDVNQTVDIRSLFVAKYTTKGTVPAVLIDRTNEIVISASKAWNGFGNTDTDNIGEVAPWFIQDCNSLTMIGCSTANATTGIKVYCNTKPQTQISLINPLFENIVGIHLDVGSSDPENKKTANLVVVNPRFEDPSTGGFSLNGMIRGHIDAGPKSVNLMADTSVTTIIVDDLSQVTNSGTSNMVRSRSNEVNDYEGIGHDINVVGSSGSMLRTLEPGDGEAALIVGLRNESGTFLTRRVKVGAADSGGAGLRAVYVEN